MRARGIFGLVCGAGLSLGTATALGHHSVAAGFDMNNGVSVTGTIKSMEWTNPHARLYVDVVGEDGQTESWTVWFGSANNLFRLGWRSTDLPVGQTVTVSGYPARNGAKELYGGKTKLPDGRTLFADPRGSGR